ncbi:MAG: gamma-glutamyltransferase [Sphingomonadales bacterium]|nr:gamma-glutamyltransferase [Sphingomonadales bacterium]
MVRLALFIVVALAWIVPAFAQSEQAPIIRYDARFNPVIAPNGMVAAQERRAAAAGAEMLAAGGNAVDAAVATGFALAVTLPQAGNLGGGGFMLIHLAEENRTIAIDYREMAPAAAHRDLFLDAAGNVDRNLARFSLLSTGVPGTVAGLVHALENYGTMELEDVIQPAIDMAEDGIAMSYPIAQSLSQRGERLQRHPASARYFFKEDGSAYAGGDLWVQEDLAWTLKRIRRKGAEAFYRGRVAERIVAEMEAGGGLITMADLAAYRPVEREAVRGRYDGYEIIAMPPPSSGGVHVIQMLNVLEGYDLRRLGHNSAAYLHLLVETMKRAYADRSEYLGDPDFYPVPVAALTDKGYAAEIRSAIDPGQATPSAEIAPAKDLRAEAPNTTHYSVVDAAGNMVSNTYTLNFSYGNGIAVTGAGFLLNNEMDDFSAKPGVPNAFGLVGGEANAIEAGKRPLSSMTPVIVLKDGRPWMATGSPGGSTIINAVLQMLLNVMEFDMNIAAATAAPRLHHQWLPDRVFIEPGISPDTVAALVAIGHQFGRPRILGATQTVMAGPGVVYGATDPRRAGGGAEGY